MYKWDAEKALELIEKERITTFVGVPTMSWELLRSQNLGKYDLSSLVCLLYTSPSQRDRTRTRMTSSD